MTLVLDDLAHRTDVGQRIREWRLRRELSQAEVARLAGITTLILLLFGTPLAWWLARTPSRWREPVSALAKWKTAIQMVALGFLMAGEGGNTVMPARLFPSRSTALQPRRFLRWGHI